MTTASVPSTLVKCLYLFFDLIPTEGDTEEEGEAGAGTDRDPGTEAEFTPRERRILLQKMFMQVNINNQNVSFGFYSHSSTFCRSREMSLTLLLSSGVAEAVWPQVRRGGAGQEG